MKPAWKQAYSSKDQLDEAKKQWIKALVENNLHDISIIDDALAACRADPRPFLPSPGEFLALCRKAYVNRLGALEEGEAYRQLIRHYIGVMPGKDKPELNPFLYHLITDPSFDSYNFRQMRAEDSVKYFTDLYRARLDAVLAGEPLRKPIARESRIEKQEYGPVDKERGKKTIQQIRAALGMGPSSCD